MKNILIFRFVTAWVLSMALGLSASVAQQLPAYSQYFWNPYLYNPSFAGNGTSSEVFMNHRQQWMGIEDAPVISHLSVHLPTNGRMSFAAALMTDKSILLRNSTATLTSAYLVPFSADHYLKFGLSLGVGVNMFDLNAVADQYDPLLANVLERTHYMDGQFGFHYFYKGLTVGFALPRLFKTQAVSAQAFNDVRIEQLKAQFYTVSYKWEVVPQEWALEPVLVWKAGVGTGSQWEGCAVVHFREVLWAALSYREQAGAGAAVGINYRNSLRIGYAYDFAAPQKSRFGQGTHELQLSLRMGKEKRQSFRSGGHAKKSGGGGNTPSEQQAEQRPAERIVKREEGVFSTPPARDAIRRKVIEGEHPQEMKPSHYVIVASFEQEIDALRNLRVIKARVPESGMGYNSEEQLFYIYIYHTTEAEGADQFFERIIRFPEFKNARILQVVPKK